MSLPVGHRFDVDEKRKKKRKVMFRLRSIKKGWAKRVESSLEKQFKTGPRMCESFRALLCDARSRPPNHRCARLNK